MKSDFSPNKYLVMITFIIFFGGVILCVMSPGFNLMRYTPEFHLKNFAPLINGFSQGDCSGCIKVVAATAIKYNLTTQYVTSPQIRITYYGGQDAKDVENLSVKIDEINKAVFYSPNPMSIVEISGTSGKDHVVVIASFRDGKKQVIFDNYL